MPDDKIRFIVIPKTWDEFILFWIHVFLMAMINVTIVFFVVLFSATPVITGSVNKCLSKDKNGE